VGLVVALVWSTACIPQNEGEATEIDDEDAAGSEPPVFPETGRVPDELLVDGLVWDFTNAPADLNLWVPSDAEARCAAEKIVAGLGDRVSDLGYLPDTSGASLNDIALTQTERQSITSLFESCIDRSQAMASLLLGQRSMTAEDAACMADGLVEAGVMTELVEAWAFGEQVDPYRDDGAVAGALVSYANICLGETAFFWLGVDLPGDEDVVGVGEGSGDESEGDLPDSAGTSTVPGSSTTSTVADGSGNTGEP
jgi:hypothetical protein